MSHRKRVISQPDVMKIFEKTGTIVKGHFVFPSGKHGDVFIKKDGLSPHTETISALARAIAYWFVDDEITTVVGPALGGVVLSQRVAEHLCWMTRWRSDRQVFSVYAERVEAGYVFRRGYDEFIPDQRVLVVEDILLSGNTTRMVCSAVRSLGGKVVGVAALCNLGNVTIEDIGGAPELYTLTSMELGPWSAEQCPLCACQVPVDTELGEGPQMVLAFG